MAIETRGRVNFSTTTTTPPALLEGQGETIRHTNSIAYHIKDDPQQQQELSNNNTRQEPQQGDKNLLTLTGQEELAPDQLPRPFPVQFNILGHMQMRKPLALALDLEASQKMHFMDHSTSITSNRRDSHSGRFGEIEKGTESNGVKGKNSENSESPLDFSFATNKKAKISSDSSKRDSDSPCSRLRNMLNMKSPEGETVLNLSSKSENTAGTGRIGSISPKVKEEQKHFGDNGWNSGGSGSSTRSSTSHSNSNSCSPVLSTQTAAFSPEQQQQQHQNSLKIGNSNPISPSGSRSQVMLPMNFGVPSQFGAFSPTNLSPILSHTIPTTSTVASALGLTFDPSQNPFYSHNMMTGGGGQGGMNPFGNGSLPPTSLSMVMAASSVNNSQGGCHNGQDKQARGTRPFKAYPKDPMTFPTVNMYGLPMAGTPSATEAILHQQSNRAYADFRKQMLARGPGKSRRGGQRNLSLLTDVNSMSTEPLRYGLELIEPGAMSSGAEDSHSNCEDGFGSGKLGSTKSDRQAKDEAYWERRRKNNEAAKRSRDARRAKEDEIAIRAVFLEQENMKLRLELCTLRNETTKLRCLLYGTT